ncbi:MAG TPA: Ig-like domain-containing protein [Allosphingosinicella sp.]|nr:Ig-like domain-containing protein [Allosphingosinicella sp.]
MRVTTKTIATLLGTAALALAPSTAGSQYNNPPVANPNSLSIYVCQSVTINLTGNDTDPEGHYPLTVTAVDSSPYANTYISSASSVVFEGTAPGGHTLSYTVEDSQGASSVGLISLGVFSGGRHCN